MWRKYQKLLFLCTYRSFLLFTIYFYQQMHIRRIYVHLLTLYIKFGTTRLKGTPRNRWQDEVRDDGKIVGGEGWQK
jgi:hypothetical protein